MGQWDDSVKLNNERLKKGHTQKSTNYDLWPKRIYRLFSNNRRLNHFFFVAKSENVNFTLSRLRHSNYILNISEETSSAVVFTRVKLLCWMYVNMYNFDWLAYFKKYYPSIKLN